MNFAIKLSALALFLSAIFGCSRNQQAPTPTNPKLLQQLRITEWDIEPYVGQTFAIQGDNGSVGKCEVKVGIDTRLVTQVSSVNRSVIIYVIDSTGVGSTVIETGDKTAGLRTGEISNNALYRYNDTVIVSMTTKSD